MNLKILRILAASMLAFVLVILAACSNVNLNTEPGDLAADFELTNLNGDTMTLADTEGKVRLVYFYFSHCTTGCVPATYFLSKVQDELKEKGVFGKDVEFLQITFDPERDTTERLKEFAALNKADTTAWHFLRGEEQYSRDLALKYKIAVADIGDGQFAHTNAVLVINQLGYVEKKYFPVGNLDNIEPSDIVDYVMELLKYKA